MYHSFQKHYHNPTVHAPTISITAPNTNNTALTIILASILSPARSTGTGPVAAGQDAGAAGKTGVSQEALWGHVGRWRTVAWPVSECLILQSPSTGDFWWADEHTLEMADELYGSGDWDVHRTAGEVREGQADFLKTVL